MKLYLTDYTDFDHVPPVQISMKIPSVFSGINSEGKRTRSPPYKPLTMYVQHIVQYSDPKVTNLGYKPSSAPPSCHTD
jgi:hypothetical protein